MLKESQNIQILHFLSVTGVNWTVGFFLIEISDFLFFYPHSITTMRYILMRFKPLPEFCCTRRHLTARGYTYIHRYIHKSSTSSSCKRGEVSVLVLTEIEKSVERFLLGRCNDITLASLANFLVQSGKNHLLGIGTRDQIWAQSLKLYSDSKAVKDVRVLLGQNNPHILTTSIFPKKTLFLMSLSN